MKAKELLSRIEPALKAVHARTTIPIMQTVRFGGGKMIGADMEIWATVDLPEYDLPDGCVSAEALGKALGTTMRADADVSLTVDGGKLVVRGGGRRASLAVVDAGEYPVPPKPDEWTAEADLGPFRQAAVTVAPAASTNEAQYHLCGVAWCGEWAVGASSASLIRARAPRCAMGDAPIFTIASVAAMPESGKLFANRHQTAIEADWLSIFCRMIDGSFPDYERIFPSDPSPFIVADADALADLVKAVGWGDASKARTVILEEAGGKLAASSRSAGGEIEAAGEIDAEVPKGLRVAYASEHLLKVLAPLSGVVTFERDEQFKPARIWQDGADVEAVINEWRA